MPIILDRKPKELRAGNSQETIPQDKGERIQNIVNGLVWTHGKNVSEWASWPDLLRENNLEPKDVTKLMLYNADVAFRKKVKTSLDTPSPESEPLIWKYPVKEGTDIATWDSWWTSCRRYRVTRSISMFKDGDNYFGVSYVKGTQQINGETVITSVPKKFKSIRTAFLEAEKIHCQQCGLEFVKSNKEKVLTDAEKDGLTLLPGKDPISTGEISMNVSEKDARDLLVSCGHEEAKDWSSKRLTAKINDLPNLEIKKDDGINEKLFDSICEEVAEGKEVVVESEGKEETQEIPVESNGKKKKKPVKESKVANPVKASNFFIVDLRQIKANTYQPRKSGVIHNLNQIGYGLFEPVKSAPNNPTIWEMLTGNNPEHWKEAIDLIDDHEPDIKELADSIAVHTQLQNVGLVEMEEGFDVIYGMRRCIARAYNHARSVGDTPLTIKAEMAKDYLDTNDLHFRAMGENKGRKGETLMDEAKKYHFLKKQGLSVQDMSDRDGNSIQNIHNRLKLLRCTKDEQERIQKGSLGMVSALNALKKREDGGEAEAADKSNTKKKLPSSKQVETVYRSIEQPDDISDEEWELFISDDVRKFISFYLGFDYVPYEEMKEMNEAAAATSSDKE